MEDPKMAVLQAKKMIENVEPNFSLLGWVEFISKIYESERFKEFQYGKEIIGYDALRQNMMSGGKSGGFG